MFIVHGFKIISNIKQNKNCSEQWPTNLQYQRRAVPHQGYPFTANVDDE